MFSAPEEHLSLHSIMLMAVVVVMLILVLAVAVSYYRYARQSNLKIIAYLFQGVVAYLSLSLLALYLFDFFYLEWFEGSLRFYMLLFNPVDLLIVFVMLYLICLFLLKIQAYHQTFKDNVRISSMMTLFSFSGKINRKQFLTLGLFPLLTLGGIVCILFMLTLQKNELFTNLVLQSQKQDAFRRLAECLLLFMLWPVLAIHVKRWRDRGRSFWWFLLLPTIVGAIWIIGENWVRKGSVPERA